jgi:hypothetical protein
MALQSFWRFLKGSPQPFRQCCLRRLRLYLATASRNTPETGPQNTLGTTQVQPRSTQGKPPSSIPETPKEHPRNTPGTPQEHPESTPNTAHQHSQNIPGAPKEHLKSTQERPGASQEHPGEPPGSSLKTLQKCSRSTPTNGCHATSRHQRFFTFIQLLPHWFMQFDNSNRSFYTCVKSLVLHMCQITRRWVS